ncbi:C40 family peptidase [Streptomyces sp. RPT161]|uniref:C40 family peptidase n=1 Tax=Streptomyces sp. RPT161 TaxID=3015993 RepID=UPI0022B8A641|nr:NlpC/P60 family protein [Streptomyces sp. RPT161]
MRLRAAAVASTVLACAAGLLAVPGDAQAAKQKSVAEVRAEVDRLYRQAETATQSYDAVTEQIDQQQRDLVTLARAVVAAQSKEDRLTQRLGALARAQYRSGGGLPLAAQFLLSTDPASFLNDAGLAEKGAQAATTALSQLRTTKDALEGYASAATRGWESLTAEQARKAAAKQQVERRLAQAQALLGTLAAQQRARLRQLDDESAYRSQADWLKNGVGAKLGGAAGTASALGARAVAFASAQLGKAYEWGAQGPSTYDCSGLTEMAWAAAGVAIPRTSQEQWARLPHIPLDQLRPGDLVIYYSDASHVAIYVGDGAIIQAPRPGRTIDITGAGSMPILGAVRPG